jgi:hypothetical protein
MNIDTLALVESIRLTSGAQVKYLTDDSIQINGQLINFSGSLVSIPRKKVRFRLRVLGNFFTNMREENIYQFSDNEIGKIVKQYNFYTNTKF